MNNVPDRILSFDPVFQYRFTKYLVDFGHLPAWDELTYYVGRRISPLNNPPLMWYLTAFAYLLVKSSITLKTLAAFMGAFLGALITIPAFLLGRELSNKYGGLMAAMLVGTAPQILVRTFGASFDTDQIVLFFILLTSYLGIYALRKQTIGSVALAVLGFSMFMMTWGMFWYPFFIVLASAIVYYTLHFLIKRKVDLNSTIRSLIVLVSIAIGIILVGVVLRANPIGALLSLIGFARKAEAWIVNISIAELQPFNIFNWQGWMLAMGKFSIGMPAVDNLILLVFFSLIGFGLWATYRKNLFKTSVILAIFFVAVYTTFRGIRFTEFSSALFIVIVSAGFGYFFEYSKRDRFLKIFSTGLCFALVFLAVSLGHLLGQNLGPDMNSNWDSAWAFLRTTPENSLVGTWWDPGHMITGLAERRVVADGAHCGFDCMYTINDRIVDLGKIFATSDENVSLKLIRKYQGTSPKVYWIASDDLIGKFRWLQFFGTGCDGTGQYTPDGQRKCPLYYQIPQSYMRYAPNGEVGIRYYSNLIEINGKIPIVLYTQNGNAYPFKETIYYENGGVKILSLSESEADVLAKEISSVVNQLGFRMLNDTVQLTAYVPEDYSYVVLIPPQLRNSVFTKMFFLEGNGLKNFKQVFRNNQVKIYEVVGLEKYNKRLE